MSTRRGTWDPLSLPVGVGLAILALAAWEIAARNSYKVRLLGSSPSLSVSHIRTHSAEVLQNLGQTGLEAGSGLVIAVVVAIALSVVFYTWPRLASVAYPWLVATQVIPFIAIAPMVILVFGPTGPWGKIALSSLVAFFPVLSNLVAGFRTVRSEAVEMMQILKAGKLQTLRYVIYPHTLPHFFAGLRIATPLSVIGAIVAEFNGADVGVGRDIFIAAKRLEPEVMVVGIVCGAFLAAVLYGAVSLIERALGPWYWKE